MKFRNSLVVLAATAAAVALPASAAAIPSAPGAPSITSKPKSVTNASKATIAWTAGSGATPSSYECRTFLNGVLDTNWQSCSSPVEINSHKGATDTLQVRGVAGSLKGTAAIVSWRSQDLTLSAVGGVTATSGLDVQNENPEIGTVLVAGAPTVSGSSGIGSIAYQWLKCTGRGMAWYTTSSNNCTEITGATGRTFKPTKTETGWFIRVRVTYTSDTHFSGNTFTGQASRLSEGWVQPPVGKLAIAPSLVIGGSGSLNFGKVIGYNIGTYTGGFVPCLADATNWETCNGASVETSLQYCDSTDESSCVDAYNMTTARWDNTDVKNAMGRSKGSIRILEPSAIGKYMRLHTKLYYVNEDAPSILAVKDHYSAITNVTVEGPTSTVAPTININPYSFTSQYGTQSVPKRGRTISANFGSWVNVFNWGYYDHGSRIYGFYETRPFVNWYRCSSPTDDTTCTPVNRKVVWRTDGSGYLTYTPDTDDIGNYIRARAAYSVCYSTADTQGDCPYWWSDYSDATAQVIRN